MDIFALIILITLAVTAVAVWAQLVSMPTSLWANNFE